VSGGQYQPLLTTVGTSDSLTVRHNSSTITRTKDFVKFMCHENLLWHVPCCYTVTLCSGIL